MGVHPEDKQDDSTGKDVEHPLRPTRNPHLVADMEPSVQKRKSSKIRRKWKFWWKWNNRNVKPWPSEWERYRLKTIWMGGMETKTIWTIKNERGISDNFKNGRGMGPVLQGGHMGDAGSCHSGEQFFLPTHCTVSIQLVLFWNLAFCKIIMTGSTCVVMKLILAVLRLTRFSAWL